MPLIQTDALILQTRKFSETSKIIIIFSQDKGRLGILVKGGRKGTKKFPGGLETLNRVELQFYYRPGRELQNYQSADLISAYPGWRHDLQRTYTALSLAETVLYCTLPEDANPNLFNVMVEAFTALEFCETRPWTIRWHALLATCRTLGFELNVESCLGCGSVTSLVVFDLDKGGFLCKACRGRAAQSLPTSGEVWGVLRFLSHCPIGVASRLNVTPEAGRAIEKLFLRYLKHHLPSLKTLESWKALAKMYWGSP